MAAARPSFPLVNLASAFLAGPWTRRSLLQRGKHASPNDGYRMRAIVTSMLEAFGTHTPPPLDALIVYLGAVVERTAPLGIGRCFWPPREMAPRGAAAPTWRVPALTSAGALAEWLQLAPGRLDWLADARGWTTRQPAHKLRHYVCRWLPRRGGFRLVESPKPTLKTLQRRILHELLDHVPPHPAAHGFRKGRSILTFAAPHVGREIVLRFDLRDFFTSIAAARVHALFRTIGYPDEVARLLTGLCTTSAPAEIWESRPDPRERDSALGDLLRSRHLPQGAPTSPALANLCARRLDARLSGLAHALDATYTRYADDLAFSGGAGLERACRRFQVAVAVSAAEEGFELNFRKSRFMRRGVCQQLAGVVVNERLNVRRSAYDELKAILTNCIRHGPATQNRAAHADFKSHLLGRIAHVRSVHPRRGVKLAALWARIAW